MPDRLPLSGIAHCRKLEIYLSLLIKYNRHFVINYFCFVCIIKFSIHEFNCSLWFHIVLPTHINNGTDRFKQQKEL